VEQATGPGYHFAMLLRRHGDFIGGVDLPDEKRETLAEPVRSCTLPESLRIPLTLTSAAPAEVVVTTGQSVEAGAVLARGGDDNVDVFAPVAGVVSSADASADVAGAWGLITVPAIELSDLQPPSPPPRSADDDALSGEPADLRRQIAAGQLTCFRRPMQPVAQWLLHAQEGGRALLIANVMENQPYVTADHRILTENGQDVLRGLALLARAIEADKVVLAVDQRRTDDYRHVVPLARRYNVQLVALPHKYPIGVEEVLLKVLTGIEAPVGRGPTAVGASMIDAATCLAVCRWIHGGYRAGQRVVTVAGEQIVKPANYLVPFGTPCEHLAGLTARSLIHNGPMVALPCTPNTVVTPATDAVLALAVAEPARPTPCIRCGWCSDHCPARLNVAELNDAFELVDLPAAHRADALACMGCGICSYVCPARLPLTERAQALRRALTELAPDDPPHDHANMSPPSRGVFGRLFRRHA